MAKIAILTSFNEMRPGYSLTGIVKDQITMLRRYGHEVHLFVQEGFNYSTYNAPAVVREIVPFAHLQDYQSKDQISEEHKRTAATMSLILKKTLQEFNFAFTHDWLFTGWNLPYAMGIFEASRDLPGLRWLHWIHSVPSNMRDWWDIKARGPMHRLVYPNKTDAIRVAEQFRGTLEDVLVIPHIKDLRSWFDFSRETVAFIEKYPGLMRADVVQVYPASSDRFAAKGLNDVFQIFAAIKRRGLSVCLIVANQWATPGPLKEETIKYEKMAERFGLKTDEEVVFTSEYDPQYEIGLDGRMLRELFQCSNLFIFPTREESFGLVLPEAVLAGGILPVLNRSLNMLTEVSGGHGLYFDFGSFTHVFEPSDRARYLDDVASIILGRLERNEAVMTKTFVRQRYNWDYIYRRSYEPVLNERTYGL